MDKKIKGIVVNERSYSETSKIINILTEGDGIIGLIAKGAKGLKSPLRNVTTKLTYGLFNIRYKEKGLSTLISVDIIDPLKQIKKDITMISYASFIADLSEQVEKHSNNQNVFSLLSKSLLKINEGFDPMVISNILELKYLDFLGVMPIIDECSICGNKKAIVTLSVDKGGYVCKNCHTNEKIVSEKTIKLIRMFYYVDIAKISKLEISNSVKKEINEFLDNYYDKYTGLYLKSKSFVHNLNKINIG